MSSGKIDSYFAKLFKVTTELTNYVNKNGKVATKTVIAAVHKKTMRLKKTLNGLPKEEKLKMIEEAYGSYSKQILQDDDDDENKLKWLEDGDLTFKMSPKHCIKISVYYMIAKDIQKVVTKDLEGSPDSAYEGRDELNYADIIALQTFRLLTTATDNKEDRLRVLERVGDLEEQLGIDGSSSGTNMPPFMDGIKDMLGGLDVSKTLGEMGIDLGENGGDIQSLVDSFTKPGEIDDNGTTSSDKIKNIIGKMTQNEELGEGIGDAMKGMQDGNMDLGKLMGSMGGLLKNPGIKGKLNEIVQATISEDDPEKASRIVNNLTEGNMDNLTKDLENFDVPTILSGSVLALTNNLSKGIKSDESKMSRGAILNAIDESSNIESSTSSDEVAVTTTGETGEVEIECDDDICLIKTR